MTIVQRKAAVDTDITSKTAPNSITTANVADSLKGILDELAARGLGTTANVSLLAAKTNADGVFTYIKDVGVFQSRTQTNEVVDDEVVFDGTGCIWVKILSLDTIIDPNTGIQWSVINSLPDPPSNPQDGYLFKVENGATGLWTGQDGKLALWVDDDGVWNFTTATNGDLLYNSSNDKVSVYNSSNNTWTVRGPMALHNGGDFSGTMGIVIGNKNSYKLGFKVSNTEVARFLPGGTFQHDNLAGVTESFVGVTTQGYFIRKPLTAIARSLFEFTSGSTNNILNTHEDVILYGGATNFTLPNPNTMQGKTLRIMNFSGNTIAISGSYIPILNRLNDTRNSQEIFTGLPPYMVMTVFGTSYSGDKWQIESYGDAFSLVQILKKSPFGGANHMHLGYQSNLSLPDAYNWNYQVTNEQLGRACFSCLYGGNRTVSIPLTEVWIGVTLGGGERLLFGTVETGKYYIMKGTYAATRAGNVADRCSGEFSFSVCKVAGTITPSALTHAFIEQLGVFTSCTVALVLNGTIGCFIKLTLTGSAVTRDIDVSGSLHVGINKFS